MIFFASLFALSPLVAIALYNLRCAPRLENFSESLAAPSPTVSVLVSIDGKTDPGRTLASLKRLDYPDLEFLFVVDSDPMRVAASARGEILLFCNGEISASPLALRRSLNALCELNAPCLSALPRTISVSWAERALRPFVRELPLSGLFPLRLQPPLPVDPEWMVMKREALANPSRKMVTILATQDLSVRREKGWRAVWSSLVDRIYPLAGGTESKALGLLLLYWFAFTLPLAAFWWPGGRGWAALLLLAAFRLLSSALFASPGFEAVAHPVGAMLFPFLMIDSYRVSKKRHHSRHSTEVAG